jgi:hypothetical protein
VTHGRHHAVKPPDAPVETAIRALKPGERTAILRAVMVQALLLSSIFSFLSSFLRHAPLLSRNPRVPLLSIAICYRWLPHAANQSQTAIPTNLPSELVIAATTVILLLHVHPPRPKFLTMTRQSPAMAISR